MKKLEQHFKNLAKCEDNFDLGFKKSANDLAKQLRDMGIGRPKSSPRISDPAHERNISNSYSSSPILQDTWHTR
ncbi:MAG: hypothetical protein OXC82_01215 [Rhodobacteraceae bacterium]|nr:hypothetical protein [Paracoccaceae bacterium]MCY4249047.1 hypothetical protein [Paracoccaceae bacterium]